MNGVRQFLRHAFNNPLEHGRAIIEHGIQILVQLDIGAQILVDVNVELCLHWLLCQVDLAGPIPQAMEISAPTVMMFPSGSSQVLKLSVSAADVSFVS